MTMRRSWTAAAATLLLLVALTMQPCSAAADAVSHRPAVHSTLSLKRIHPLLSYELTTTDGAPLPGFHPDAPPSEAAQLRRRRTVGAFARAQQRQAATMASNEAFESLGATATDDLESPPPHSGQSVQPFPDELVLSIRLPADADDESSFPLGETMPFGSTFAHNIGTLHQRALVGVRMRLERGPAAVTLIRNGNENGPSDPDPASHTPSTYRGQILTEHVRPQLPPGSEARGWLVLTLHAPTARFHASLRYALSSGEEVAMEVVPVEQQYHDMPSWQAFEALRDASLRRATLTPLEHQHADGTGLIGAGGHGMVVHSRADLRERTGRSDAGSKCGVEKDSTLPRSQSQPHGASLENGAGIDAPPSLSSPSRRLLGLSRWASCYPGDTAPHTFGLGIIADAGYFASVGSGVPAVQSAVAHLLAATNALFQAQFNVRLRLDALVVYTSPAQTPGQMHPDTSYSGANFNEAPSSQTSRCAVGIRDKVEALRSWREQTQSAAPAVWHLLTNCYGGDGDDGPVGLAYTGAVCNGFGVSISSNGGLAAAAAAAAAGPPATAVGTHWERFAHELGHNFGARHSDQGGLMGSSSSSFGTGFAPDNRDRICAQLSATVSSRSNADRGCFEVGSTSSSSGGGAGDSCGNGVVDGLEQCDDASPCCDQSTCRLKLASQCSGGGSNNPCCDGATCLWKPSSATCDGGAGYCVSGACHPSSCRPPLTFCATSVSNPCRQSCRNTAVANSTCTDSYVSPELSVVDGAMCRAEPYSLCSGGICTAVAGSDAQFQWRLGEWGECSCAGRQTRTAECVGGDGIVAGASQCASASQTKITPALEQACTKPASCATYAWRLAAWGACTQACGSGGTQAASAQCVATNVAGAVTVVAPSLCAEADKPAESRPCNTEIACSGATAGATYAWTAGAWSACSVSTCGGGTATRSVSCRDASNAQSAATAPVADYLCTGAKPTSVANCLPGECVSYAWRVGSFGACSASCDGGTQTRALACQATQGAAATTVAASMCSSAGAAPPTSQPCNTQSCSSSSAASPSYYFFATDWISCTKPCGGGVQSRRIWCAQSGSFSPVASSLCSGIAAPPTSQACNTEVCTASIVTNVNVWQVGAWSRCSSVCGTGVTRQRDVRCVGASGAPVDASLCEQSQRPDSVAPCSDRACPTYWHVSEYGPCSMKCNGGLASRTVECRPAIAAVSGWLDRLVGGKSESGGSSGDSGNVTVLADSACAGTKPSSSASCNQFPCPSWEMTSWGPCDSPCGDGVQHRNVSCTDSLGLVRPEQECAYSDMPPLERACTEAPCGYWAVLPQAQWSPCSAQCGGGNQSRPLVCILPSWASSTASSSSAASGSLITRPLCPVAAGSNSNSYALLQQQDSPAPLGLGSSALLAALSSTETPPTSQVCNTAPCPATYWAVVDYSACSAALCGGGTQRGKAACVRAADGAVVDAAACSGAPPAGAELARACNTGVCPRYEFVTMGDWGPCDVECGRGKQRRAVACINAAESTPAARVQVDVARCLASAEGPAAARPASERDCTVPENVCYGLEVALTNGTAGGGGGMIRTNGRCVAGQCACRSGYGDRNCTGMPRLSNVRTNMDPADGKSAPPPLSFQDKIQINWDSTGQPERVSVLLARNPTGGGSTVPGSVPQYIATSIPNTGSFLWHIGTSFLPPPPSDSAVPSFRFEVYYSPSAAASSETSFTFADPCAYLNCGLHGMCRVGQAPAMRDGALLATSAAVLTLPNRADSSPSYCECVAGYSGLQCEIGPCAAMRCSAANSRCSDDAILLPDHTTPGDDSVSQLPATVPVATAALCNCTGGYSGNQCVTPPGDACAAAQFKCQNGGDLDGVISRLDGAGALVVDSCGKCKCTNNWGGADCSTCTLRCRNGGTPSADCKACHCGGPESGFFGSSCECRYYIVTLHVRLESSAEDARQFYFDKESAVAAANRAVLQATLRTDLLVAARELAEQDFSVGSIVVDVSSLAPVEAPCQSGGADPRSPCTLVQAKIKFGLECPELSSFERGRASFAMGAAAASPSFSSPSLSHAWSRFSSLLSDLDSAVYRGVFTSQLDSSMGVASVLDPSGVDRPAEPARATDPFYIDSTPRGPSKHTAGGFRSLSRDEWIGVACGAGAFVFLLVTAGLLMVRHRRREELVAEAQRKQEKLEATKVAVRPSVPRALGAYEGQLQMLPVHVDAVYGPSPSPSPSPPPGNAGPRYLNPYSFAPPFGHRRGDPSFSVSANPLDAHEEPPVLFPQAQGQPQPPPAASPSQPQ